MGARGRAAGRGLQGSYQRTLAVAMGPDGGDEVAVVHGTRLQAVSAKHLHQPRSEHAAKWFPKFRYAGLGVLCHVFRFDQQLTAISVSTRLSMAIRIKLEHFGQKTGSRLEWMGDQSRTDSWIRKAPSGVKSVDSLVPAQT